MALEKNASYVTRMSSVTASDTVDCKPGLLYIGTTGSIKINTLDGDTVTLTNIAQGIVHPIWVTRVWATGTTATDMFTCK
tara:strand:- start:318 stop:557 length:240 start_codon:yes stop_codon:yes gene_type:complete